MHHFQTHRTFACATLALLVVANLAGCGGGGSADPAVPAPEPVTEPSMPILTPKTSDLQGIWQSPASVSPAVSAIVLPDGLLWAVSANGGVTQLVKTRLSVQTAGFQGSGTSYTLGGNAATSGVSATAIASVVEKTRLTGTLTLTGGEPEPFALAYQSRYDIAVMLSDYAGVWRATLGPGVLTWTIDSTGAISGTRSTGCTYSGQLSMRPEQKAVLDAAVIENCAGTVVSLNGVGVFNADKTRITMLLTTPDESTGVALNFGH